MFESGLEFLRADFHLHTQKDKEFSYSGEPNDFVKSYISALKQANISVGVITNHNKFACFRAETYDFTNSFGSPLYENSLSFCVCR